MLQSIIRYVRIFLCNFRLLVSRAIIGFTSMDGDEVIWSLFDIDPQLCRTQHGTRHEGNQSKVLIFHLSNDAQSWWTFRHQTITCIALKALQESYRDEDSLISLALIVQLVWSVASQYRSSRKLKKRLKVNRLFNATVVTFTVPSEKWFNVIIDHN